MVVEIITCCSSTLEHKLVARRVLLRFGQVYSTYGQTCSLNRTSCATHPLCTTKESSSCLFTSDVRKSEFLKGKSTTMAPPRGSSHVSNTFAGLLGSLGSKPPTKLYAIDREQNDIIASQQALDAQELETDVSCMHEKPEGHKLYLRNFLRTRAFLF